MRFLDSLGALLVTGISPLSAEFLARQSRFLRAQQHADGGFPGRRGASDPYYTDFALRLLVLLPDTADCIRRVGQYFSDDAPTPRDVVECFSYLNMARLLRAQEMPVRTDDARVLEVMQSQRLPSGGFARPGGGEISAYHTFLAALCCEILNRDMPDAGMATVQLLTLQCTDGGFGDHPGEPVGQTNATAAAIATLMMLDALDAGAVRAACAFLAGMQADDGGLRAHAGVPAGDLLSTFTGMLTLLAYETPATLDIPAVARFVKRSAVRSGGFGACPGDEEADVEYTYYGVGVLALLRAYVEAMR